jgi:hypothetical protein
VVVFGLVQYIYTWKLKMMKLISEELLPQSEHDHPTCPLLHLVKEVLHHVNEEREHSEDCGEQISAL